jgi:uncharacterized delta-60 repeat protein
MKALLLALLAVLMASSSGAQVPLTLDTSFRCTRIIYPGLTDALPLANGSVVVGGSFMISGVGPLNDRNLLKLLPNGAIDETWAIESGGHGTIYPHDPYYYSAQWGVPVRFLQSTGEYTVGWSVGGANYPYPNLNLGNGGDIYVQADGKILCTGDHHLGNPWGINEPGYYSLLRVNPDATLDSTYHYRQTDGVIWTLVPTTQGRLLVSGVYNTYEGLPEGRILRIWPDGSLDSTFHSDIIKGYAQCLVEQPNGRILAGGQFVYPNDPDTLHLIRLMPDGTLDTSFDNHAEYKSLPPGSFGDFGFGVYDALQLEDGRIIVGGSFTHIDGQLRRGVALLDSTGHLLNTALNGQGCGLTHDFNSTFIYSGISSIRMAPDGSIFLAGALHGFDDGTVSDTGVYMICKLHGLSVGIHEIAQPAWQVRLWPNPGADVLHVEANAAGKLEVRVRDAAGRTVLAATSPSGPLGLSSAGLGKGVYLVEVHTARGRKTVKWVKQ